MKCCLLCDEGWQLAYEGEDENIDFFYVVYVGRIIAAFVKER